MDLFRYGLYAVTAILGAALLWWIVRSRRLASQQAGALKAARRAERAASPSTVKAFRGIQAQVGMSEALAGIRLPLHWQPDPPDQVRSPLTLTTTQESEGQMAELLSDELARIGYRVAPSGRTGATAERFDSTISIEVESDGSFVLSRLTLAEASVG